MLIDIEHAKRIGRETVAILQAGNYTAPSGRTVVLDALLDECRKGTIEYPPDRAMPLSGRSGRERASLSKMQASLMSGAGWPATAQWPR